MAHNQCIATGPVEAAGTVYVDVGYAAGNCVEAAVTGKLVYGSGGTSIRVRLEGSYDAGATWTPVGDMLFGTASAEKTFIVQSDSTDVFNPGDPLPDNTVRKALPPRLRVSKVVTGTYAGSTLDVWIGLKENAAFKVGQLDTDATMAANSDARVPSQKAVKTRLDAITLDWINLGTYPGVDRTGVADSYAALQAAYNAIPEGGTGYLPPGTYKLSQTLRTKKHRSLIGAGVGSKLLADNISGPVVCTYDGTADVSEQYQRFRDFSIGGTASCAVSFTQCYGTVAERIKLIGFTGLDGFRFEGIWQCQFRDLDTSNTTIGRACFKVNRVCLDSIWSLCYTGGTSRPDYSLYVNKSASDDGNMSWAGFGMLHFDTFTAQAADVVGFGLINAPSITLTNPYTESCHIPMQIGNITGSGWAIQIFGGELLGGRGGETPFGLAVNSTSNLSFHGTRFYDQEIICGWLVSTLSLHGVGAKTNTPVRSLIRRTVDGSGKMPIAIFGDQGELGTSITLSVSGTNDVQEMSVDGSGVWSASKTAIPLSPWRAIKSLTASGLTATVESPFSHGYSTGNTVVVDCASPKVFNGTFTIAVVDATHFTYTLPSAPRESPAIGQPMMKKV